MSLIGGMAITIPSKEVVIISGIKRRKRTTVFNSFKIVLAIIFIKYFYLYSHSIVLGGLEVIS